MSLEWNKAHPEKVREAMARYRKRHPERIKEMDARNYQKKIDRNEKVPYGNFKCVSCGMTFKEYDVMTRGFRLYRSHPNSCLCDECGTNSKRSFYDMNE